MKRKEQIKGIMAYAEFYEGFRLMSYYGYIPDTKIWS